jgi:endonuclease III
MGKSSFSGPTMMPLPAFLTKLKRFYGDLPLPEPRDPFELIVWENAAYLVTDERRALVFEELNERIGIGPAALLGAGARKIGAAIRDGGMQPSHRAAKVLRCAEIAVDYADGELFEALHPLDSKARRTLLKRFPGIADPGVAKVLLFCGLARGPAIESNGLRVLERLGLIDDGLPYAAAFRAGVEYLLKGGIESAPEALEAFALLRHHGRELCKRTHPDCARCPLRKGCPYARRQRGCAR